MKNFHIGDLVTLSSGIMVSPTGRKGLFDLVDYMTGMKHTRRYLFNVQFWPDTELCTQEIIKQFPWLTDIKVPNSVCNEETGRVFLDRISEQYGSHHNVERINTD